MTKVNWRNVEAGEGARELLARRLERLGEWRREIGDDPAPEAVHQIRVSARRLRAALSVFGPLLDLPPQVRIRPLRRLEARFGALRDLDVMTAALAPDGLPTLDEAGREGLERVASHVTAHRLTAVDRARWAARRRRLHNLIESLAAWLEAPRYTPPAALAIAAVGPDLLLPALSRVLLHAGWLIGVPLEPDAPSARVLHSLRRRLKELRYRVECLEDWYGEPVTVWLAELHALQDALGAWHDEALLLDCLERAGGPPALGELARARARHALAMWPEVRSRYLEPRFRLELRQRLGGGASSVPRGASGAVPPAAVYSPPAPRWPSRAAPDPLPRA